MFERKLMLTVALIFVQKLTKSNEAIDAKRPIIIKLIDPFFIKMRSIVKLMKFSKNIQLTLKNQDIRKD